MYATYTLIGFNCPLPLSHRIALPSNLECDETGSAPGYGLVCDDAEEVSELLGLYGGQHLLEDQDLEPGIEDA